MPTDRKRDALREIATRGGTPEERENARLKLASMGKVSAAPAPPAVRSDEADDKWEIDGRLARTRKGNRSYMRRGALRHFLKNVRNGEWFKGYEMPYNEDFRSSDFYVVLSWLLFNDLALKKGESYCVPSKSAAVAAWNKSLDDLKL
jgi:hypothetical protein